MDWILKFEWNGLLGIALYWVPLLFCAVFYTVRTAEGYMADKAKRDEVLAFVPPTGDPKDMSLSARFAPHYTPRETVGAILGRALVSVTPVANIWAAAFDLSPKVFARLFSWIGKVFDQPLVPPPAR